MTWFDVVKYTNRPRHLIDDYELERWKKLDEHIKIFERGISDLKNEKENFSGIWERVVNEINGPLADGYDDMRRKYTSHSKFPRVGRFLGSHVSADRIYNAIGEKLARLEKPDYKEYSEKGVQNIETAIPYIITILNKCIAIAKRGQEVLDNRWAKRERNLDNISDEVFGP